MVVLLLLNPFVLSLVSFLAPVTDMGSNSFVCSYGLSLETFSSVGGAASSFPLRSDEVFRTSCLFCW